MKTSMISLLAAAALVSGFTVTEAVASPSNDEGVVSRKVAYPDLDISRPQGAKALLHRIRNAASIVCAGGLSQPLQNTSRSYRKCVADAANRAVADVNSPMVTALHSGSVGTEIASNK